ncbi:hypothetical protein BN1002_02118 [Bacillus sp. B-jedd]|nr:hypothetical protein BN1002_02118 [Bacillus sp. B-jedd]
MRKRLRDRQQPPRDRQKASVPAMLIPGSFPLCPCDDYTQELSFVVSPDIGRLGFATAKP